MTNNALMIAIAGTLRFTAVASADPVLVQQAVAKGVASGPATVTLASAPTAGNTLTMELCSTNTGFSPPDIAGWAKVAVDTTTRPRGIYKRTADGTESTTFTTPSFPSGASSAAVQEWVGSVSIALGSFGSSVQTSLAIAIDSITAPAARAVPLVFGYFTNNSSTSLAWPTGWTSVGPVPDGSFPVRGGSSGYTNATSVDVPAFTITGTTRGDTRTFVWTGLWVTKA